MEERFILEKEDGHRCIYLKISDENALNNMRKGEWWFRHTDYFRYAYEEFGDTEIGDVEDNIIAEKIHSQICSKSGNDVYANMTISCFREEKEIDSERVVCFYCLDIDENNKYKKTDEKMKAFGQVFSLVDMKAMLENLYKNNYEVYADNIKYTDGENSGNFGKSIRYKHQHEYRILIKDKKYSDKIANNNEIRELTMQLIKVEEILKSNDVLGLAKIETDNKRVQLKKEIMEKKQKYIEKIKLIPDLISAPIPISVLFDSNCIYDWYI